MLWDGIERLINIKKESIMNRTNFNVIMKDIVAERFDDESRLYISCL
jgi:hypothetical protein